MHQNVDCVSPVIQTVTIITQPWLSIVKDPYYKKYTAHSIIGLFVMDNQGDQGLYVANCLHMIIHNYVFDSRIGTAAIKTMKVPKFPLTLKPYPIP